MLWKKIVSLMNKIPQSDLKLNMAGRPLDISLPQNQQQNVRLHTNDCLKVNVKEKTGPGRKQNNTKLQDVHLLFLFSAAAGLREEASVQPPRSGGERPHQPTLLLRGALQGRGHRQDRRGGRGRAAGVRARQLRHGGQRGRHQEHHHRLRQRVRSRRQEQSRQVTKQRLFI